MISEEKKLFDSRLNRHRDELKWLYMELYDSDEWYKCLEEGLWRFYKERNAALRAMDLEREAKPDWYRKNDMLGMMLYVDNFAGNLKGVKEKLPYLEKAGINYVHLMPLLESPKGRSDGGYAVADFRKVQPELGTMEDLAALTEKCHQKGISVCLDFVMNHTSEEHEWARKARQGDKKYQDCYFFFDDFTVPALYEKTVPQVFPTTAPGNFTWLPQCGKYVMTTFYPYQWDLNYRNPMVFQEMMFHFLFLANQGIDILRIDAVPYIWKELGTNCRNLPRVHSIVRMMRMITEIVCPGVLLLGEVVMEPEKVVPYFGTVEKPECHMLYNVTTMATIWHTVASHDVCLLKKQLDTLCALPGDCVFLNYLRCHDDIGWGLDYASLWKERMQAEIPHKKFLNDYFRGCFPGSVSSGELYNDDPVTQDARFCGTTASMCGIEKALAKKDEKMLASAIDLDIMLHAFMLMQSGIPMLYSGDEVAQLNDWSYREEPEKRDDSRYIHRGKFDWEAAKKAEDPDTVQGKVFTRLKVLEEIRRKEAVFEGSAAAWTIQTWEPAVLCMARADGRDKLIGIYNFSPEEKMAWIDEKGSYTDLVTGETGPASGVRMPGYGFRWLKQQL